MTEQTSRSRPVAAPVALPPPLRRRPSQRTPSTPDRPASPPAPTPLVTPPEPGPRRQTVRQPVLAAPQASVPSTSGRLPWLHDVLASKAFVVPCYNEPTLFRPARYGFEADPSMLPDDHGVRMTLQARSGLFNLPAGPPLRIEAGPSVGKPAAGRIQVLAGQPLEAAQTVIGPCGASVLFWTSSQVLALHCSYSYPHWSSQQQLIELGDSRFDMQWLERHGQRSLGVRGRGTDAQLLL